MIINADTQALLFSTKKSLSTKKISLVTAVAITSLLLTAPIANAASEITITQPVTGSTTVVEQYSDGNTATITATPNGISMQDGMPYAATQIINVPRYTVRKGASTVVTTGAVTSQVTQQVGNTLVTTPVTTPMTTSTQVMVPVTTTTLPVINNQVTTTPVLTNQTVTTTTLDALQLTPTFSTPDLVSANTKIMKILKDSNGREMAVPANSINPGDIIEYHTTYVNNSNQPINDINAMVNLPNGVKLVSLNSPLPTFATTGGDTYQTIQQVGNTVVITENYSGLKWDLVSLANNTPQTVVIRAKVQ